MAKGKKSGEISFWSWFFILFVQAIPCIGLIMSVVWAFAGNNESKKNYFKAQLAWGVLWMVAWMVIIAAGFEPSLKRKTLELTQKALMVLPDDKKPIPDRSRKN